MTFEREAQPSGLEASSTESHGVSRRAFCRRAGLSAAALAALACVEVEGAQSSHGDAPPPKKIEYAELLMPGYSLPFRYPTDGDLAILVRARDGSFHAFSQNCTHLGCPVFFDRTRERLECPCHEGAYDLQTGAVTFGPPPRPLRRIEIETRANGEVWAIGRG